MIIFSDIDGVIATNSSYRFAGLIRPETTKEFNYLRLDVRCIDVLNFFIKELNEEVEIVVSSAWRNFMDIDKMKELLSDVNAPIIGHTPRDSRGENNRGDQIVQWLKMYRRGDTNYVILDDEVFDIKNKFPADKIIDTSNTGFVTKGLTKEHLSHWFLMYDLAAVIKQTKTPFNEMEKNFMLKRLKRKDFESDKKFNEYTELYISTQSEYIDYLEHIVKKMYDRLKVKEDEEKKAGS